MPHTALVHADGDTPDLAELIAEMSDRTESGYLFGGIAASRGRSVQFAVGGNGNIAGQGAARGCSAEACRAWRSAGAWACSRA